MRKLKEAQAAIITRVTNVILGFFFLMPGQTEMVGVATETCEGSKVTHKERDGAGESDVTSGVCESIDEPALPASLR